MVPGAAVRWFFVVFWLAALFAAPLGAQSTFGSILGTVRDSTGAMIENAQVTLINTGTTAAHTAVTDATGNYAFRNIDVGSYSSPSPRRV